MASYRSDCQIYGLDSSRSGKENGLEGCLGRSCYRWGVLTLSVAIPVFLTYAANLMNANDSASSRTCIRDPLCRYKSPECGFHVFLIVSARQTEKIGDLDLYHVGS